MKTYTITVNGVAYDVTVEENSNNSIPLMPNRKSEVTNTYQTLETMKESNVESVVKSASASNVSHNNLNKERVGDKKIEAPMPGKILSIKGSVGQPIKRGDVLFILEAMKLENEIVASEDGVISTIEVNIGDVIESGVILATFN